MIDVERHRDELVIISHCVKVHDILTDKGVQEGLCVLVNPSMHAIRRYLAHGVETLEVSHVLAKNTPVPFSHSASRVA
jgi:hypothetical protein